MAKIPKPRVRQLPSTIQMDAATGEYVRVAGGFKNVNKVNYLERGAGFDAATGDFVPGKMIKQYKSGKKSFQKPKVQIPAGSKPTQTTSSNLPAVINNGGGSSPNLPAVINNTSARANAGIDSAGQGPILGALAGGGKGPSKKKGSSNKNNETSTLNIDDDEFGSKILKNFGGDAKKAYEGTYKHMGNLSKDNLRDGYGDGSWGGVAKHLGKNMAQGAVAGGVVGGTINYAQGGSFWDGAVSGAVNGGIAYGAYRTGLGAAGVKGNQLNVFGGVRDTFKNVNNMYHDKAKKVVGAGVKEHLGLMSDVQISNKAMSRFRKESQL